MLTMMTALLITFALAMALMFLSLIISKKSTFDREKASPFECGFEPNKTARIPFSLRFFLIAVIFLIFDVEITLILPIPLILTATPWDFILPTISFFILVLVAGLFYEWFKGALEWT